jgi:hypothetical protein
MPPCLRNAFVFVALLGAGLLLPWSGAFAQQRTIRVIGDDGQPVAFANVTVAGEGPKITNEKGEVEIGSASRASLTADVRRLGYEPWYGKLTMGDTVMSAQVTLHRISRRMFTVTITDSSHSADGVPAYLRGFYERMLARQRGIGSGIYLTPEEVDKRNSNVASALLQGLNGVSLQRTSTGKTVAMSSSGRCQMTVLIDGRRACPYNGCDAGPSPPSVAPGATSRRGRASVPPPPGDGQFVLLDNLLGVNEVAAVEVYPRGATIPPSLPSASDASCGLIAFWTGGRKAP